MLRTTLRRTNGRRLWFCWFVYALGWLLMSLDLSTATFSPLYNPLQPHSYYPTHQEDEHGQYYEDPGGHPPSTNGWDETGTPRGGSTMTVPEPPQFEEEPPFHPPTILLKHVSMALRLTSEWNRRLFAGVNKRIRSFGQRGRIRHETQPQQSQLYYNTQPVNINPTRAWAPPIKEGPLDVEEELTIFHAKKQRESEEILRGVARWGPELLPYLEHVVQLLGISNNGIEIPLAMIFLDRACSVETIRSNGCPPCPFCMPRTVHRLSLVALLLATQAVNGKSISEYIQDLESLGIPPQELEAMAVWMRSALGDDGQFVTVSQMKLWSQTWDATFFPRRQQTIQTPRPQNLRIQEANNQYQSF
eukprot:scaffold22568_cov125-Cylindrotheca_fusiformis.AAC.15